MLIHSALLGLVIHAELGLVTTTAELLHQADHAETDQYQSPFVLNISGPVLQSITGGLATGQVFQAILHELSQY